MNMDAVSNFNASYSAPILYDSREEFYKTPFGCLAQDETLTLTIALSGQLSPWNVQFVLTRDGETDCWYPMEYCGEKDGYMLFSGKVAIHDEGLYFYHFWYESYGTPHVICRDGYNRPLMDDGNRWQITVTDKDFYVDEAYAGKIMYQIFPDRFAKSGKNSAAGKIQPYWLHMDTSECPEFRPDANGEILNNDFYGGNLRGITEKLEYIRSFGVSVIYLNPIFMAFSNHRYDTADYKQIDPMLGTEGDFRQLLVRAHELGMKVLLDGVFSHTGSKSVYFDKENQFGMGAYSHPNSPYKSWYRFSRYPQEYESWWGIDTLPCVDELNPSYLNYILYDEDSVVKHWLRLGVDGFRLDVADELPDEFLRRFKEVLRKENPHALLLGEVWEDASNKISYSERRKYFWGKELDSVMNYVYKDAIIGFVTQEINAAQFSERVMSIFENYPKQVIHCAMNLLSTHDTPRIATALTGVWYQSREERAYRIPTEREQMRAKKRQRIAVFLQYTLPGMPCIYYGDEIGMQGFEDPFNRRYFDWDHRSEEIMAYYRTMGLLKNAYPALQTGFTRPYLVDGMTFGFTRETEKQKLYCICNVGSELYTLPDNGMRMLCEIGVTRVSDGTIQMAPYSYAIFADF